MPTLIDKAGTRYPYTVLDQHGTTICLDGLYYLEGSVADYTIEPDVPVSEDWTTRIADRRYTAEVRGFIWNNVFIDTDRVSQPKIASARQAAKDGVRSDTAVWKCGNPLTGLAIYRVTSNAEMVEIGDAAFTYVQSCYDREGVLVAAVADDTITSAMLDQGWPT